MKRIGFPRRKKLEIERRSTSVRLCVFAGTCFSSAIFELDPLLSNFPRIP
jgi:hypothetical protein